MAIVRDLPKDASVLDLDAARVARAEVRAEQGLGTPYVKLSAGYVAVHAELPIEAAFAFQSEDIRRGLELILVDTADIDALFAEGLSAQDLNEIAAFVSGKPLGESEA